MTDYHDPLSKAAKDFLAEAEEIFDQLSGDILSLGDSVGKEECAPETVNSIFRSAHSLKGLAGMFGYGEIAELVPQPGKPSGLSASRQNRVERAYPGRSV